MCWCTSSGTVGQWNSRTVGWLAREYLIHAAQARPQDVLRARNIERAVTRTRRWKRCAERGREFWFDAERAREFDAKFVAADALRAGDEVALQKRSWQ